MLLWETAEPEDLERFIPESNENSERGTEKKIQQIPQSLKVTHDGNKSAYGALVFPLFLSLQRKMIKCILFIKLERQRFGPNQLQLIGA